MLRVSVAHTPLDLLDIHTRVFLKILLKHLSQSIYICECIIMCTYTCTYFHYNSLSALEERRSSHYCKHRYKLLKPVPISAPQSRIVVMSTAQESVSAQPKSQPREGRRGMVYIRNKQPPLIVPPPIVTPTTDRETTPLEQAAPSMPMEEYPSPRPPTAPENYDPTPTYAYATPHDSMTSPALPPDESPPPQEPPSALSDETKPDDVVPKADSPTSPFDPAAMPTPPTPPDSPHPAANQVPQDPWNTNDATDTHQHIPIDLLPAHNNNSWLQWLSWSPTAHIHTPTDAEWLGDIMMIAAQAMGGTITPTEARRLITEMTQGSP